MSDNLVRQSVFSPDSGKSFKILDSEALMGEADSYYRSEAERIFQEAYQMQMDGKLEDAIVLYRKSLELFPTAEAHTFLGWAFSFQGHYDAAIDECHKAIEIDPEFGNPYNDIGAYMIEKGRLDDAIPWLEKAIQAKRYDSYCFPHYNLGRVWEKKGNWMRALSCYQSAVRDNPEYTLAKKAAMRIEGMLN